MVFKMICRNCGRVIPDGSLYCPFCGAKQDVAVPSNAQVPPVNPTPPAVPSQPYAPQTVVYKEKDEGITALLALVGGLFGLWGIGHLYVGEVKKGIMLLILGFLVQLLPMGAIMVLFMGFAPMYMNPYPPQPGPQLMFSLSFFALAIWGIIVLVLFIWQVFDAYNTAKRYNEYLRTYGRPPW